LSANFIGQLNDMGVVFDYYCRVLWHRIAELMNSVDEQHKQETAKRANKKSDIYSLVCFV